jgi:4-hydroxy-tetrahydrodipicolinate synthase
MTEKLRGLCTITLTPFKADGSVDEASLRKLTDFYINLGVHGMTILGIMGEVHKLTENERLRVMEIVLEHNAGRVPVIVGCSSNSTDVSVYLSRKAEEAGATAVMIAPPQNLRNDSMLYKHYAKIAESTSIPIVLQDEPVTTGVILSPDFIAGLAEKVSTIQYVKLEEAPTTIKITKILEKTNKLEIFGGLGGMYFYEELARGASGIMTGFAYPEILVKTYELFAGGLQQEARSYFYNYLPLIRFEAQLGMGGVAIRKETFKLRGAVDCSHVRFPSAPIDQKTMEELKDLIQFLDLKL